MTDDTCMCSPLGCEPECALHGERARLAAINENAASRLRNAGITAIVVHDALTEELEND